MIDQPSRLSVFGLGYVGCVSAACFAEQGHTVIGVDPQKPKTDLVNAGKSPIIEPGLPELISDGVAAGRLRATADAADAVAASDISIVCVGTPSQGNGSLDTRGIARVCEEIGAALARKREGHIVVIRSTVLPGTIRGLVAPTLEKASGKTAGRDFGLCNNPEFLRESTAVQDFYAPPKTVIGTLDRRSGETVAGLYKNIEAPLIVTKVETAEMVKYADNAWHAVKVAFGNEIGNVCKALGIDSHEVMDIFCQDTKLNISPYYLRPGFAFGGSCLPKDLRALLYKGKSLDLSLPVLSSVLASNQEQIERAIRIVADKGLRRIGVLGFSFKAGTDDLRESPLVELIERLLGKGFDLRLFDHNVNLARLVGANRDYILKVIPHIANIMVGSIDEVLQHGEVILVGNNDRRFHEVAGRLRPDQVLVDLVRIPHVDGLADRYDGINW
jgi:GDP-mannose 6-dehydrogenase